MRTLTFYPIEKREITQLTASGAASSICFSIASFLLAQWLQITPRNFWSLWFFGAVVFYALGAIAFIYRLTLVSHIKATSKVAQVQVTGKGN